MLLRKMSKSAKLKVRGALAHLVFFTFLALVVSGSETLIASETFLSSSGNDDLVFLAF
jgi:hypothetical protein